MIKDNFTFWIFQLFKKWRQNKNNTGGPRKLKKIYMFITFKRKI